MKNPRGTMVKQLIEVEKFNTFKNRMIKFREKNLLSGNVDEYLSSLEELDRWLKPNRLS